MKRIGLSLLLLLMALTMVAANRTRIAASDPDIVYVGRISMKNPKAPMLGYTGAQITAMFEGTSVDMILKPNSGYYMVEIDGGEPYKVHSAADSVVHLASGLKDGVHRVAITQLNEAILVKFPTFHGFLLDDGKRLAGKPQMPTRKIEVIGNSITCALGIEDDYYAKNPSDTRKYQNAYYSYAWQTARALDAQCVMVSRSGIGCYRNNGGDINGDPGKTMPAYYPHTLFSLQSELWDFSRYQPDVVCVNLGTNDTAQKYYTSLLTKSMKDFIRQLRGYYPNAKIVLLSGTMRKGKRLEDLTTALNEAVRDLQAEGMTDLYRFDLTPADGSLGYGTAMHPSLKQHTQMAEELTAFLRQIMNW